MECLQLRLYTVEPSPQFIWPHWFQDHTGDYPCRSFSIKLLGTFLCCIAFSYFILPVLHSHSVLLQNNYFLPFTPLPRQEISPSQLFYAPKVNVVQSRLTLCDAMDSIVHGLLQARILKRVAFPFCRGSSQPRDQTQVSLIAGRFFTS